MKKKVLMAVMGLLFVADVVMTLFNIDIFSRFLKEKRKENDERIKRARANSYHEWSKNLRENFLKAEGSQIDKATQNFMATRKTGRYPWPKEEQ